MTQHSHGHLQDSVDAASERLSSVTDHPAVETGARVGYAANGVMHLVIAFIAVQLALGHYAGNADQSGALGMLAKQPGGIVLLVVGVIGWSLLSLWQLGEAVLPWAAATDRVKAVSKAVVYAALAWTCLSFARHRGTSSRAQNIDVTRGLLTHGWGVALVVVAGLVVVGVGGYHVYKGWTTKFLEDLRRHPGPAAVHAGRVGYIAKGVALVIAGLLLAQAGVAHDASKAGGLDGAFRTVLEAPFGRAVVAVIGLGFAAYAVYSAFRARDGRV